MNCIQQHGMGSVWGILPLKAKLLCDFLTAVHSEAEDQQDPSQY